MRKLLEQCALQNSWSDRPPGKDCRWEPAGPHQSSAHERALLYEEQLDVWRIHDAEICVKQPLAGPTADLQAGLAIPVA